MGFNNQDTNNDAWEWRDEEYSLQSDSRIEFSNCIWDNLNVNEDSFMHMLDEQTPIKDVAEISYQAYNVVDNPNKEMEYIETSQTKRRRMLQFNSESNETGRNYEQFTSQCLKSKARESSSTEDGLATNMGCDSQWNTGSHADRQTYTFEGWDPASEGFLANCFNDTEMHCSLNEMDDLMADEQLDASESYNISHATEMDVRPEMPNPSPIKIIRGKNSFLKTPKKLVTPVVYPFALIKPCGAQGDVTLKDINQKIHAPPPKPKLKTDESSSYPTSAFSGKPVVLKTKIRTEGGRGSITIMRTKG